MKRYFTKGNSAFVTLDLSPALAASTEVYRNNLPTGYTHFRARQHGPNTRKTTRVKGDPHRGQ